MKQYLNSRRQDQQGYMVLEACIVVPIFLFCVLTVYGLICLFTAQNAIGHAVMESAQSLALDAYATNKSEAAPSVADGGRLLFEKLFGQAADDPHFSSHERWFDREEGGATIGSWQEAAKQRFIGYFAGGDRNLADEKLQAMNVVDGLDGLNFRDSRLDGKDLYVNISYKIGLNFAPMNGSFLGITFQTKQQSCARMWGASLQEADIPNKSSGEGTGGGFSGGGGGGGGSGSGGGRHG